jgi:hypothetical protein
MCNGRAPGDPAVLVGSVSWRAMADRTAMQKVEGSSPFSRVEDPVDASI